MICLGLDLKRVASNRDPARNSLAGASMNRGKLVFAQITQHVPLTTLRPYIVLWRGPQDQGINQWFLKPFSPPGRKKPRMSLDSFAHRCPGFLSLYKSRRLRLIPSPTSRLVCRSLLVARHFPQSSKHAI